MTKKISSFLLLLCFSTLVYSQNTMKILVKETSIEVPYLWLAQYTETPTLFAIYSPMEPNDTFQENCNLAVQILDQTYNMEEFKSESINQLENAFETFELIESESNYNMYKGIINGISIQQIQYYFLIKGKAYILTCSSNPENFDRYKESFETMIKSFRYGN